MPIIDADGYFNGDRFDMMSDDARSMWPSFFLASNTVGRIELNYLKVTARVFSRWKKRPTEKQFWNWIQEYRDAYLLFAYEANGQIWGQWDTLDKFLPRHKMSADLRSPAPVASDFLEWKRQYVAGKSAKLGVISEFKTLQKTSEGFPQDFGNVSEGFRTNVRGIGVGVVGGIGVVEKQTPAEPAGVSVSAPASSVEWFESSFWPLWPVKENKEKARDSARKIAPEERQRVIDGIRQQAGKIRSMDRPIHAATWINQRRWEDEQPRMFGPDSASQYVPGREGPRYEKPVD